MSGMETASHSSRLRARVFDVLPFIEDHNVPVNRRERFRQHPKLTVIDYVKIGRGQCVVKFRQIGCVPNAHTKIR